MNGKLKSILLSICMAICLTLLSSCLGETAGDGTWTPTGKDITLLTANEDSEYVIVFAPDDEVASTAASDFKSKLLGKNIQTTGMPMSDGVSSQKKEIIFGPADRDVSRRAKELLDGAKKSDLNCVFYYFDEKLAIIADSEQSYEMALDAFFARYLKSGKVSFKDTLCECVSYSDSEYLDLKLEIFIAESEATRAEHESAATPDLLAKLETQRNELAESGFFGRSTANIGVSMFKSSVGFPRATCGTPLFI